MTLHPLSTLDDACAYLASLTTNGRLVSPMVAFARGSTRQVTIDDVREEVSRLDTCFGPGSGLHALLQQINTDTVSYSTHSVLSGIRLETSPVRVCEGVELISLGSGYGVGPC